MTKARTSGWLLFSALCVALVAGRPLSAADLEPFTVGYLQLKNDSTYSGKRTFARFLMHPIGRPYVGAKVALKETKFHAMAAGLEMKLKRKKGKSAPPPTPSMSW